MCGAPRVKYLASAMPPTATGKLVTAFDAAIKAALADSLGAPSNDIPSDLLYDRMGAGFPCYSTIASSLYWASRDHAIRGVVNNVELVTTSPHETAQHNLDAQWLWYDNSLTPAEFVTAFCLRLGFVPPHLRLSPCKCDCGVVIACDADQIDHTMVCDRFTAISHYTRHNILRDEVARVASTFGITTTKEPTIYPYEAGKKRPDLLFHTSSVCSSVCSTRQLQSPLT